MMSHSKSTMMSLINATINCNSLEVWLEYKNIRLLFPLHRSWSFLITFSFKVLFTVTHFITCMWPVRRPGCHANHAMPFELQLSSPLWFPDQDITLFHEGHFISGHKPHPSVIISVIQMLFEASRTTEQWGNSPPPNVLRSRSRIPTA